MNLSNLILLGVICTTHRQDSKGILKQRLVLGLQEELEKVLRGIPPILPTKPQSLSSTDLPGPFQVTVLKPSWHPQITPSFLFLFWFCDFSVSNTPQPGLFLECKCSEGFGGISACAGLVYSPECQVIALLRLTSPLWSTFCFHFLHISQLCSLWSTSSLTPPSNSFSRLPQYIISQHKIKCPVFVPSTL